MSHNQSRAERTGYRKTGRSGSFQQRNYSGGGGGKGGGGFAGSGAIAGAATSISSNQSRSFKKYNNSAQGGQYRASGLSVNLDRNNQSAENAAQNGAHAQQQLPGVSDALVTSAPVKQGDESAPNTTAAVPKSAVAGFTTANSGTAAPATPTKGDASQSIPLQFGSLSPGCMNGMPMPARTSSAPPNINEQKRDQAQHQTSRASSTLTTPSVPKQLPKKDGGTTDLSNTGEAHSKSKRDSLPPGTQTQRSSLHRIPGTPMQMPFHQVQIPLQFGGLNPQVQSQAVSAASMPIPMPMSLPIGNPPVQQPMFISALQPHQMQSQGLIHQGHGLNFSSPMGPSMSPQPANMGINIGPQFSQQQPGMFGGPRKVKITHPDTHEELRFDGSAGPRSQPNMPPQSQPVLSFQHPHPITYYPISYNSSSILFRAPNFLPVHSSQISASLQSPKSYNQVTLKSGTGSYGGKDTPLTNFPAVGSTYSKLQEEGPVNSQQSKHGYGPSWTSTPGQSKQSSERVSTCLSTLVPSASFSPSTVPSEDLSVKTHQKICEPHSVKDEKKSVDSNNRITQDQVGGGSSGSPSLCSNSPEVKSKATDLTSTLEVPGNGGEPPSLSIVISSDGCGSKSGHALEGIACQPSNDSGEITPETKLSESEVLPKLQGDVLLPGSPVPGIKSLTPPEVISVESSIDVDTEDTSRLKRTSFSGEGSSLGKEKGSGQEVKTSPLDAAVSGQDQINVKESDLARFISSDHDSDSVCIPPPGRANMTNEEEAGQGKSSDLISQALHVDEKSASEPNITENTVPTDEKDRKELIKNTNASAVTHNRHLPYKGEENKKTPSFVDSTVNTSCDVLKQISPDIMPKVVRSEKDVADFSIQKSEPPENENPVNGVSYIHDNGEGSAKKKYSRDFLLKFIEHCSDLPEGFEFTSDISDALMFSNANVSRESFSGSGRVIDRPVGGPRPDHRGSGMGVEDKWSKLPGPPGTGRDVRLDIDPGTHVMGFRPGQGDNISVLRNPRAQMAGQFHGGILTGPMPPLGPQFGVQRNNSDSDRWARATGFLKGFMVSPQTPLQVMHRSENKYQVGKVRDEEEAKQRQLKAILNKLTPQNFEKLFQQVKEVNIDNAVTLTGVISQIFDKALMEPTFCEMYASFCHHLAAELPDLSVDNQKITFRRLLLNKCQEEFERGEREEEEADKADQEGEAQQSEAEREEKRLKARRRMLGNIRLIGELYKKKMLTERIMHECIKKLLGGPGQIPDEEDIEALCKLMSTIGVMIDHPKAKEFMDAYFDVMAKLSTNMKLSSRVRFMLLDAIDLRKNKWQQRRKFEGPKKIDEVHRDAAQERQAQVSRVARAPGINNFVRSGQPVDFASRGSSMLSPGSQMGGTHGVPPHLRFLGSQGVQYEDRHLLDSMIPSVPLPQRSLANDSLTLGPQGGLGRGMSFRGPTVSLSSPVADVPSPGDTRRMTAELNRYGSVPERSAYDQSTVPSHMLEQFSSQTSSNQSRLQGQGVNHGNEETTNTNCNIDTTLGNSPSARGRGPTVSSEKAWPEERLRDMSNFAIKEFYSARDENEVVLCIKDLNSPSFYPSMISLWVADSFERKDTERDLLVKLLVSLLKSRDGIIRQDQLIKGFESVLMTLEDAVNDAPRAAEFLGRMFGKFISENVISLAQIGQLIFEGGEEHGHLVEIGLAAEILGSILETIETEKGESVLTEIRTISNLRLEDFRPPGSKKPLRLD